jgi:hypothetical protein
MGIRRYLRQHLQLHQTTGFPSDEARGRPDLVVKVEAVCTCHCGDRPTDDLERRISDAIA